MSYDTWYVTENAKKAVEYYLQWPKASRPLPEPVMYDHEKSQLLPAMGMIICHATHINIQYTWTHVLLGSRLQKYWFHVFQKETSCETGETQFDTTSNTTSKSKDEAAASETSTSLLTIVSYIVC